MLKIKKYGKLVIFILVCLFICNIPRAHTQYISPLRQQNAYMPFFSNSLSQKYSGIYYSKPAWENAILPKLNTSILFNAYRYSQINHNIWTQDTFSNYNYYYNPFKMDIWDQYNNVIYNTKPLWIDSFLQGSTNISSFNDYRFSGINQTMWSQDILLNFTFFNNNEYPTFNIPINWQTNFPVNFNWIYSVYLFPQKIQVDHLSKGYTYFQNEDYESAIEELLKAISSPYEEIAKTEGYLLLGMSYQALGTEYLAEAERYLEKAAGFQIGNTRINLQLAKVYYQQGKYSKSIEKYNQVIDKEPENNEAIRGLALSYFRANDLTKALKELEKAKINDPNDLEIIYTMGIIYMKKNLYLESIQYLDMIIDIAPDTSWASQARDHLYDIELTGVASSIEDIKEEEIKMLIMTAPEPEDRPDDSLFILLDDIRYQLLPDDTLIYRTHKLIKIMDERGKDVSEIKLSYDSSYQYLTIDLARVIKPDGTVIGASGKDIQEATPWTDTPFYGNFKVIIISMPGITVGSVLEYQVTIEDIPASKLFEPREIGSGFRLSSVNPVHKARIEVSVPADREFNIIFKNSEPFDPEVILNGEIKNYIWRLNDIPKMIVEPMMPPILNITPVLYITSFSSWETIADWWRGFEFQTIVPDDAIISKVEQLTEGLYTLKDKARTIFHYVASKIRYVGIEYGKSSVIPRNASETYENKYGDCKNKSILLISMLREAGISEAYPVLISTVNNGRVWEEVPRITGFNHVITLCIINDEWIWMDPTVETSSFGDFPAGDQDCDILVIFDNGYKFMRTSAVAPEKNTDREVMNVTINSDLNATIFSTITATGINAIYSRKYFKSLESIYRKQYLDTIIVGRTTGGGRLIDFTFSNIDNLNEPYKLELQYTDPYYIEWAGDIGFIKASYLTVNKAAMSEEERIYPVFLGNTSVGESIIYINLPENLKVRYLPPPITLEIPQILFISEFTLQDHTITYYLLYKIKQIYVPLEDYPEYKKLQNQIDMELKRKIIVEMN